MRAAHSTVFDPLDDAELVTSTEELLEQDEAHESISYSLYVTARREFVLVENFFSFDGRPAISRKTISVDQARAWCIARGLSTDIVERYVVGRLESLRAPESVSLLSLRWDETPVS